MLKNGKYIVAFIVALLFSVSSANCFALTSVLADDKGFLFTGRVDFTEVKKPLLTWPGTSIKANISGNHLSVIFDDQQGNNYFNVIINGKDQFPIVLALKKGLHEYNLSYLLADLDLDTVANSTTAIEIFKRTEGHEGGTVFHGIKLADNGKLLAKPKARIRKIAFFGDSITTGMGNEAADNDKDDVVADKNHYWSYAPITARNLDAEFHTVSSSGIGFMVSWFDHIMPQVYDQVSGVGNNDSKWDFTRWQPDVVVVNLGQNDSGLIDRQKRLQPAPSQRDIINAYKDFILSLKKVYPDAQFVSVLGSMDVTSPNNKHWLAYIQTALDEINQSDKQANIDLITFDFTGYYAHPRVHQHLNNAKKLTAYLKNKMSW
ncbi:MAG: GDSL-type esterase/lipase family protein [Thalassotalea sp.]